MDQLIHHIPDLKTTRGRSALALWFLAVFTLTTLFFLWSDQLIPEWQPDGEIIFAALGFLILARFFWRKESYQAKYGELAYRHAFLRCYIPGTALLLATIAHAAYMPGIAIADVGWKVYLFALGWVCTLTGAILWMRGASALGVDRLALLHVYHPKDSRLLDSGIFHLLRHPVYAGMLWFTIGLALLNDNWMALVFALLAPLGPIGWVRLVEEKELLERFPSYEEYRKRTPAFWTWRVFAFWRILFTGK